VLWALYTNTFFSTSVRIQDDRGHEVVKNGPYAIIRHPGYSGMILHMTGIPLLLGSIWALLPALLVNVAAVIRTRLEDQTLQEELPGYRKYTSEVQFRLAPGLW
jgi:protein-S-isoprenylcysteine O-methyltransferase Ste14